MVIFHSPNINFALNRGLEDYFPPNMGDSQGLCWGVLKILINLPCKILESRLRTVRPSRMRWRMPARQKNAASAIMVHFSLLDIDITWYNLYHTYQDSTWLVTIRLVLCLFSINGSLNTGWSLWSLWSLGQVSAMARWKGSPSIAGMPQATSIPGGSYWILLTHQLWCHHDQLKTCWKSKGRL